MVIQDDEQNIARKRGISLFLLQMEKKAISLANENSPGTAETLDKELAEIDAKKAGIERKRQEHYGVMLEWQSMKAARDRIDQEISTGQAQFATSERDIEGRLAFLRTDCWGQNGVNSDALSMVRFYSMVAGLKELQADFPQWLERKKELLAKATTNLKAFEKRHGIKS